MKKKVFGFGLAAIMSGVMAVGAFAGEATVDDVLAKYTEASSAVKEVTATVDMAADAAISVADEGSMSLNGNASMDIAVALDPMQMYVDAQMNGKMAMMDQEQGGEIAMTIYGVPGDDNGLVMYAGMNDGSGMEWAKSTIPAEAMEQMQALIANSAQFNAAELPITYTLADATTDVNGSECYVLGCTLTWEDAMNVYTAVMEKFADQLPEEATSQLPDADTLAMVGGMLNGLKFNIEIDVDTTTYLPMRAYMDFEGSDWVTLGAVIAAATGATNEDGSLPDVSLDVNDLHMEYIYHYDEPVEITVPDDVIEQAVDTGDATALANPAELMEEIESEIESEM